MERKTARYYTAGLGDGEWSLCQGCRQTLEGRKSKETDSSLELSAGTQTADPFRLLTAKTVRE